MRFNKIYSLCLASLICLIFAGCATAELGSASRIETNPTPTKLNAQFEGEVNEAWKSKLTKNLAEAEQALNSKQFEEEFLKEKLKRTNGKSKHEVLHELQNAGTIDVIIGLYYKPNTRAIAHEADGKIYINTAKESSGAGSPGNLAHEFTHKLEYTHFTNWAFLGRSSVPYVVGRVVDRISNKE